MIVFLVRSVAAQFPFVFVLFKQRWRSDRCVQGPFRYLCNLGAYSCSASPAAGQSDTDKTETRQTHEHERREIKLCTCSVAADLMTSGELIKKDLSPEATSHSV